MNEPASIVSVRETAVIVKLTAVALAAEKPPASVISASIVQIPESTNETRPVLELIVHTEVVELEYDLVPLPTPALSVEVIVGLVPTVNAYVDVYEPASIDNVRGVADVTVIFRVGEID